jgi:hypothetical protein
MVIASRYLSFWMKRCEKNQKRKLQPWVYFHSLNKHNVIVCQKKFQTSNDLSQTELKNVEESQWLHIQFDETLLDFRLWTEF